MKGVLPVPLFNFDFLADENLRELALLRVTQDKFMK